MDRPGKDIHDYQEGKLYSERYNLTSFDNEYTSSVEFNIDIHHYSPSYVAGRIDGHNVNKLKLLIRHGHE